MWYRFVYVFIAFHHARLSSMSLVDFDPPNWSTPPYMKYLKEKICRITLSRRHVLKQTAKEYPTMPRIC
jgi:hypothetical protein